MNRMRRVSVRFIKGDHGGPKQTWREAGEFEVGITTTIRRLSNRKAKKAWFRGSSLKAY